MRKRVIQDQTAIDTTHLPRKKKTQYANQIKREKPWNDFPFHTNKLKNWTQSSIWWHRTKPRNLTNQWYSQLKKTNWWWTRKRNYLIKKTQMRIRLYLIKKTQSIVTCVVFWGDDWGLWGLRLAMRRSEEERERERDLSLEMIASFNLRAFRNFIFMGYN